MSPGTDNTSFILIVIIGVIFCLPGYLYAGGNAEDPIKIAEKMIEEQDYNEAIEVLVNLIKTNPERIEEAEALIARIRTIRGSYNQLAAELIDTLKNDPDNLEKAVSLIDQMYLLDRDPNDRTRNQLDEARRTAKLQLDRTLRDKLLAEARIAIAEDRYADAFSTYREGFGLQRPEFLERGYPDEVYARVDQVIAELETISSRTLNRLPVWTSELSTFQNLIEQTGTISSQQFGNMEGPLWAGSRAQRQTLAELVDRDYQIFIQIKNVLEELQLLQNNSPDLVDYLVFIEIFTRGPQGSTSEGIGGLSKLLWNQAWNPILTLLSEVSKQEQDRFYSLINDDQLEESIDQGWKSSEFIATAAQLFKFYQGDLRTELDEVIGPSENRTLEQYFIEFEAIQAEIVISEQELVFQEIRDSFPFSLADGLEAIGQQNLIIETMNQTAEQLRDRLVDVQTAIQKAQTIENSFLERVQRISSSIRNTQIAIIDQTSEAVGQNVQTLLEVANEARLAGYDLVTGIAQDDENLLLRYPDQGIEQYNLAVETIKNAQELVSQEQEALQSFPQFGQTDIVQRREIEFTEYQEQIDILRQEVVSLIQEAQENIRLAMEYRQEGDELVQLSTQAAQNLNVEEARDYFEEARLSYFQSLELRNDEEFRNSSDQLILRLGDEIREAQNQIVVRRVRALLDQAQNRYIAGDFNEALGIISQAEETWELTNTTTNSEIELLKNRIAAATNLAQERELTEVDPLYSTISPYLNLARVDVNRGTTLFAQGKEEDGRDLFTRAEQNIENVLFVKPYNFQARILQIQISQILAGDEFQNLFANRYRETISRIGSAPDIDVYTDLQVLAEINPNYPGLQQNIRALEIRLGLRENPVTREALNESDRLLAQARTLTNTADSAQLQAVLDLLERAVQLNPNNQDAKILADTVRIRLGGQASLALSSADEQRFRRAESLFIQNNIAEAYAIVLQLLQTRQNQGYPPLLSLRDRIERRL